MFKKLFGKPDVPLSLPLRSLTNNSKNEYCWEDFEKDTKKKYPIRYFIYWTLATFFRRLRTKIGQKFYWLRSHTYNKYHLLDLRSDVGLVYKWGWIETDQKILLACFNALKHFVEKEGPLDALSWPKQNWYITASAVNKPSYDQQIIKAKEIKALYDWWHYDKARDEKTLAELRALTYKRGKRPKKAFVEKCFELEKILDDREDEMLIRLMKIRRGLWT